MQKVEKKSLFLNRELSWLEFNYRVLEQAINPSNPLLEQLKFITIVSSNFDEFFMVRVAGLKRQFKAGNRITCSSGLSPFEQLQQISIRVREIINLQNAYFTSTLFPTLDQHGIKLIKPEHYSSEQFQYLRRLFHEEIFPALTPVAVKQDEDFPLKGNLRLYIAFSLKSPLEDDEKLAIIQIPEGLNRLRTIPDHDSTYCYTLLEDIVVQNAENFFPGLRITEYSLFRITRDADLSVDEKRDEDFLEAMQETLRDREHSSPVRLEIIANSDGLKNKIKNILGLDASEVYEVKGILDLTVFGNLLSLEGLDSLHHRAYIPQQPQDLPENADIWDVLKDRDVLLHHPYEVFEPIVRLLQEAALDPQVLSIKMTLYRTSGNSPVIEALILAARNGKQVTTLIELKARFDEEKNIEWARELEREGVIVLYGIMGLKVHAKALIIIRRESAGITRYFHLGTGNYNEKTARTYTDISIMSSRSDISHDLAHFFNTITGYSIAPAFKKLVMAPYSLREKITALIRREIDHSSSNNPGLIMAKINSLVDPEIIEMLYEASQAGVKILLNVRGICCLKPGIKGISENIRVVSIVDHFLEHSRIFYFRNGGNEEIFLSSADLMPRNLDRRVELMFPVENREHKRRLIELLKSTFEDNQNAYSLQPDGSYQRIMPEPEEKPVRSQELFYMNACRKAESINGKTEKIFKVRRKMPEIRI